MTTRESSTDAGCRDGFIVPATGWYQGSAALEWTANNNGYRVLGIHRENPGVSGGYLVADRRAAVPGAVTQQSVSVLARLEQGESVTARVQHTSGVNLEIEPQPTSRFTIGYVSRP